MRIIITGATGFVGSALVRHLMRQQHEIVAWVRDEVKARALLGSDVTLVRAQEDVVTMAAALKGCDAIVHLAGEPIVGKRWSDERRAVLAASRQGLTKQLVAGLTRLRDSADGQHPGVFISGSAIGYYGDTADAWVDESSMPGQDFTAQLCKDWEASARDVASLGLRVVCIRIGMVLGRDGGALAKLLPIFRAGLGGPIGNGAQYMSWIHLDDLVALISTALTDARYRGAVNGVSQQPLTNREFCRALGSALHRPALLPAPAFALKLMLGEAAQLLLSGQRVRATRASEFQFQWQYPTIDSALRQIVSK